MIRRALGVWAAVGAGRRTLRPGRRQLLLLCAAWLLRARLRTTWLHAARLRPSLLLRRLRSLLLSADLLSADLLPPGMLARLLLARGLRNRGAGGKRRRLLVRRRG
jgi:hypothetical protein